MGNNEYYISFENTYDHNIVKYTMSNYTWKKLVFILYRYENFNEQRALKMSEDWDLNIFPTYVSKDIVERFVMDNNIESLLSET